MSLDKTVRDLTEKCIEDEKLFVVDVIVRGNPNNQKIQVFIDGDEPVKIEECSAVSRKLSDLMEENNIIEGRYVIEVSSPGADKPLKLIRQFPKHVGREFEIRTKENKKYQGILKSVLNDEIEIEVASKNKKEIKNYKFSLDEIEKASVVIKF